MKSRIDNPGNGDCGYYAFAIGLIEHIQREVREQDGNSLLYAKWLSLGLKDVSLAEIQSFDFMKVNDSRDLINKLQMSLREICFDFRCKQLNDNPYRSSLYDNFMAVVNGNANAQFNELANSPEVFELSSGLTVSNQSNIRLCFMQDVTSDNSKIKQAAAKIKTQGVWATDKELCDLAQAFGVKAKIVDRQHPNGYTLDGGVDNQPIITLVNQGNNHWITELQHPLPGHNLAPASCLGANYQNLRNTLLQMKFSFDDSKKIDIKDIDKAGALPDEQDEKFAERLQEAEIRAFRGSR